MATACRGTNPTANRWATPRTCPCAGPHRQSTTSPGVSRAASGKDPTWLSSRMQNSRPTSTSSARPQQPAEQIHEPGTALEACFSTLCDSQRTRMWCTARILSSVRGQNMNTRNRRDMSRGGGGQNWLSHFSAVVTVPLCVVKDKHIITPPPQDLGPSSYWTDHQNQKRNQRGQMTPCPWIRATGS